MENTWAVFMHSVQQNVVRFGEYHHRDGVGITRENDPRCKDVEISKRISRWAAPPEGR